MLFSRNSSATASTNTTPRPPDPCYGHDTLIQDATMGPDGLLPATVDLAPFELRLGIYIGGLPIREFRFRYSVCQWLLAPVLDLQLHLYPRKDARSGKV